MKRKACGWLVVLLLFVSERAAWCAETNHDFANWEKEIAAFEQMDRTNPPPKDAVLFTGASTIRRWKTLAQNFPGQRVINRGFGGSEILDATHFADRIIFPYAPRMIFLRSGGNDLWRGKSPERVFADFQEFVAKVRAKLPETEIIFISASPSPSRWAQHEKEQALTALVQQFVRGKPHLKYVDTYPIRCAHFSLCFLGWRPFCRHSIHLCTYAQTDALSPSFFLFKRQPSIDPEKSITGPGVTACPAPRWR